MDTESSAASSDATQGLAHLCHDRLDVAQGICETAAAMCRAFADGASAELPDISRVPEAGSLEHSDPFLQGLLGSAGIDDKFVKERLSEMADDATDVSHYT